MSLLYTPENMYIADTGPTRSQIVVALGVVRDAEGRILVAHRIDPTVPDAMGKWEFVGGKIEFGEDPEQAVIREVQEESGLLVRVVRLLPKVYTNIWQSAEGLYTHVVLLTYECALVGGHSTTEHVRDEVDELRFVTKDELQAMPKLPNVQAALEYV